MGDDKEIKGQEEGPTEDETQRRRMMMTMPGRSKGWGKEGAEKERRGRQATEMEEKEATEQHGEGHM